MRKEGLATWYTKESKFEFQNTFITSILPVGAYSWIFGESNRTLTNKLNQEFFACLWNQHIYKTNELQISSKDIVSTSNKIWPQGQSHTWLNLKQCHFQSRPILSLISCNKVVFNYPITPHISTPHLWANVLIFQS